MRPKRFTIVGIAALAVVTLAIVAFAFAKTSSLSSAAERVGYTPPTLFQSATLAPKRLTVAFIGDSYTAGAVVGQQAAWPTLLGAFNGWNVVNYARGGTGYLKSYAAGGQAACGQDACPNYSGIVPEVSKVRPDVVVVAGGRNDGTKFTPAIAKSITDTFSALRSALPNTKIIALSPILAADDSVSSFPETKPAVKAAVEAVGGTYVDLGAPLGGHPELIGPDGVHPNVAGQRVLADVTQRLLPKLG